MRPSDPTIIIAGIRQFGLAADGADLRDLEAAVTRLQQANAALKEALKPFAEYADQSNKVPAYLTITNGSNLSRKQLTMDDCYRAKTALASQ